VLTLQTKIYRAKINIEKTYFLFCCGLCRSSRSRKYLVKHRKTKSKHRSFMTWHYCWMSNVDGYLYHFSSYSNGRLHILQTLPTRGQALSPPLKTTQAHLKFLMIFHCEIVFEGGLESH
jgi:hypothetical protein